MVEDVCSSGQEPPAAINHTDSRSAAHEAVRPAAVESPGGGSYSGLEIHPPLATCQPLCSLCPLCLLFPAVCSCTLPRLRCSHLASAALPQHQDLGDAQALSKVLDRITERSDRCKSVKKKKKKKKQFVPAPTKTKRKLLCRASS